MHIGIAHPRGKTFPSIPQFYVSDKRPIKGPAILLPMGWGVLPFSQCLVGVPFWTGFHCRVFVELYAINWYAYPRHGKCIKSSREWLSCPFFKQINRTLRYTNRPVRAAHIATMGPIWPQTATLLMTSLALSQLLGISILGGRCSWPIQCGSHMWSSPTENFQVNIHIIAPYTHRGNLIRAEDYL